MGALAGISLQEAATRQDVSDNGVLGRRILEKREIIEKDLPGGQGGMSASHDLAGQ